MPVHDSGTADEHQHDIDGHSLHVSRCMVMQEVYLMPAESVVKKAEIARELNFVTKGTLVVTDANHVLIQLVTGEGTAPSVVGEVSFLMGVSLLASSESSSQSHVMLEFVQ